jgi:23S rRNA pseudouridine2605 synthase
MASTPETITPNQLKQARTAIWHQNGDALRTLDDARTWLDAAGLVPYYPHAQFAASPQPSFAEAILGRPENGWVPPSTDGPSEEESYAVAVEDEEADEEFDEDDEDLDEDESDEDESEDEEGDDEESKGWSPEAADDEVMLTTDDQMAEDEGDEIAEEDRIDAQGNLLPKNLIAEEAVEAVPAVDPINGFTAEEKETVSRTLARMIAEGSAVPLNLLGSTTGEPDYVCSAQAFSFVYTLRGDKNWKQEPAQTGSMRVSPLAVKVYEALKEKGTMAPHELSNEIGQGVVDSAVLRALSELWAIQRVIPVPDADGEPTKWELMSGRFVRHLKAGANAGQPTALSALLSLYLSQAVAATSDEMEIFLSPLAARSRVREVVGGLAASRQLDSTVLQGKTVLYMPGALNDLPTDATVAPVAPAFAPRSRYEDDDRRHMIESRAARFAEQGGAPEERRPARTGSYPVRRPAAAGDRPARTGGFGGPRREGGFAPRREGGFAPRREGGFAPRREGGFTPQRRSAGGFAAGGRDDRERRPFTRTDESAAPSQPRNEFARPWDQEGGERKPFTPREGGGDRRPFTPRGDGERRPFTPREGGERRPFTPRGDRPFTPRGDRPFTPREGGERRPFTPREGGGERRPFTPREGGSSRPFGDRPFTPRGDRPFTPREGGERRPFTPREGGGERRPFAPRGDRPFTPRGDGERRPFTPREGGDRKPFAPRGDRPFTPRGDRPFTPREGGERRPFTPRGDGERRPFTPREGGERRPFTPRGDRPFTPRGDRPFTPREGGERRPFTPRGDGERRPFTPREGGSSRPFAPRGDRPFTPRGDGERRPFTPREGGERRPFTPRGDGERRPFTPREGGDRKPFAPRGDRPFTPRGDGRPSFGARPSFGDRKPSFGGPRKPFSGAGGAPPRRGPGFGPGRGGAPKRRSE